MSEKNAPRTVIGPDTVVNGEIHSKQDLVIQGRVKGTLQVDAVLFVEVGGLVEAEVKANHVVVAGTFQGTLEAVDALEVAGTGRVQGQVTAPRMRIADGAVLNAEIRMSNEPAPRAGDRDEAEAPRATKTTGRSVYTYTVPAVEATATTTQPSPKTEEAPELDAPELEEVTAQAASPKEKKGGKKTQP